MQTQSKNDKTHKFEYKPLMLTVKKDIICIKKGKSQLFFPILKDFLAKNHLNFSFSIPFSAFIIQKQTKSVWILQAFKVIRNEGLSAALFAPGWVMEKLGEENFIAHQDK